MTDAWLMEADCIHGNTWWECDICEAELGEEMRKVVDRIVNEADDLWWYEG